MHVCAGALQRAWVPRIVRNGMSAQAQKSFSDGVGETQRGGAATRPQVCDGGLGLQRDLARDLPLQPEVLHAGRMLPLRQRRWLGGRKREGWGGGVVGGKTPNGCLFVVCIWVSGNRPSGCLYLVVPSIWNVRFFCHLECDLNAMYFVTLVRARGCLYWVSGKITKALSSHYTYIHR